MRILDKYIIKELAGPFIFGICAFSSIFIGTDVLFKLAKFITEQGASVYTVAKLFVYRLPGIVVLTFPMSMLLASLLAFGRLSGNSEIVAMKTGGLSFYRLTAPVVVVAFFVSVFAMYFNEMVVPAANFAYERTVLEEITKSGIPKKTQENVLYPEYKGGKIQRIIFARQFDEKTKGMTGVDIQEFEQERLARVLDAERAEWNGKNWDLINGTMYEMNEQGNVEHTMRFQKQIVNIDKNPVEISRAQKQPKQMSIKELKLHIKTLTRERVSTNELKVELHRRITLPLASLIFTIVGAPLGLQSYRSSSSIGLGQSIVIIFIYYSIMTISGALGESGTVPPVLGAWFPNLVMIAFGGWLIRRAAK